MRIPDFGIGVLVGLVASFILVAHPYVQEMSTKIGETSSTRLTSTPSVGSVEAVRRVDKAEVALTPVKIDKDSMPSDRMAYMRYAEEDVSGLVRYLSVTPTPEQQERLFRSFLAKQELMQLDLSPEEHVRRWNAIESEEAILGKEAAEEASKKQEEEFTRRIAYSTELQIALASEMFKLTPEQEEQYRATLNSDDLAIEQEIAYLSRTLALDNAQRAELRAVMHRYHYSEFDQVPNYEEELLEFGGVEALGSNIKRTESDGTEVLDDRRMRNFLVQQRIKPVLTAHQFATLNKHYTNVPY